MPDGGIRAWLVVLGGFLNFTTAFGLMNSFGIFQCYYSNKVIMHRSTADIAWIGSVQLFLMFVSGLLIGPAFDKWGARRVMIPGAFLYLLSFVCTSFAREYYQILLSQGFLFGIRNAILYYPTVGAIAEWFDRRRGLALGVAISGSSIGGIIWPLIVGKIIPRLGFAWTNRILLFASLAPLAIACVLVKELRSTQGRGNHSHKILSARKIFKDIFQLQFIVLCLALFLIVTGMLIPFNWITLYAESQGVNSAMANNLLAICYGGSCVGRILIGYVGDKFGRFNALIGITAVVSTLIYAWLKVTTLNGHIAFATLYGIFSGGLVPLGSACVAQTTADMARIGLRISIMMAACSPGSLTGNPISGIILARYGWLGVHIFSATTTILGGAVLLWARALWAPRWIMIA
ncbi:major facilitator superfamily domain-containing protein [Mariannaea sp. PMI_226]|nr:major facilitator superfamily domain-containing protein [Mariannaea sp. PMI_226]